MSLKLPFGKHKGKNFSYILKNDKDYFKYLIQYDFEFCGCKGLLKIRKYDLDLGNILMNKEFYQANALMNNPFWGNEIWNELKQSSNPYMIIFENKKFLRDCDPDYFPANIFLKANYPNIINEAERFVRSNNLCFYCMKKLVPIGNSRINGKKSHDDWDSRIFHKKCWKKIRSEGCCLEECDSCDSYCE
jgi:hypothetical protein